jgi:hypothetical protein
LTAHADHRLVGPRLSADLVFDQIAYEQAVSERHILVEPMGDSQLGSVANFAVDMDENKAADDTLESPRRRLALTASAPGTAGPAPAFATDTPRGPGRASLSITPVLGPRLLPVGLLPATVVIGHVSALSCCHWRTQAPHTLARIRGIRVKVGSRLPPTLPPPEI